MIHRANLAAAGQPLGPTLLVRRQRRFERRSRRQIAQRLDQCLEQRPASDGKAGTVKHSRECRCERGLFQQQAPVLQNGPFPPPLGASQQLIRWWRKICCRGRRVFCDEEQIAARAALETEKRFCRARQRRLLDAVAPLGVDLIVASRRESVQWLTGAHVRAPFEPIAAMTAGGHVTLVFPERQLAEGRWQGVQAVVLPQVTALGREAFAGLEALIAGGAVVVRTEYGPKYDEHGNAHGEGPAAPVDLGGKRAMRL